MSVKSAIRAALHATIGDGPTQRLLNIYGDTRSVIMYAVSLDGRRSTRELRAMRDRYRGRRAFIIGNGPSLRDMDLAPLRDEVTFGLNRIYLLFEKMGFSTTYLVSVNIHVIEQCAGELAATDAKQIFSWLGRKYIERAEDVTFVRPVSSPHFAPDPSRGLWEGATVTFVAMQIAYHMGFHEVILIGVDHRFASTGEPHALVTSQGADESHFDPSYFGKGFRWQLPDLETSETAYQLARRAFEADGRRVLNATVGGNLEVFPRVDYMSLFDGASPSS